jgi:hypothetical protein
MAVFINCFAFRICESVRIYFRFVKVLPYRFVKVLPYHFAKPGHSVFRYASFWMFVSALTTVDIDAELQGLILKSILENVSNWVKIRVLHQSV